MSDYDITVVITSFKSENTIIPCLNSINQKYKVLVVENSNNVDFKNKIESKFKNVKCLLSGENLGYAKGNNFGLSKVKTRYSLILNPDAVLDSMAIDNFIITSKKSKDFAIIAPYIQEEKFKNENIKINKNLHEVENVKGFAMFLNMPEFKTLGFFDSNFFIYFEEIDLCRRVRLQKKKIFLDSSIRIFHSGGSSHDTIVNEEMELSRNWHWMWSSFYYNKKYNGFISAFIKVFPKLLSSIFKTIYYSISLNKNKQLIYYHRLSGLINSILGRESWYRPKVL